MHVHFEHKMPCCSGTKKMLMSGSECVCRTAWIYPLRVSVTLTPCRRWGKGDLSLSCPLCLEVHPVCVYRHAWVSCLPCLKVLCWPPPSCVPHWRMWLGCCCHTHYRPRPLMCPATLGKGGLKAGRHHATAAWICNKHTHTRTLAEPGTRVLSL